MLKDQEYSAKPRKRFIASAICPQCHAFDSIQWCLEPEEYIQCVHCSFMQKKSELDDAPASTTAK
jgi:uncharacterized metal-binding protein (TIGR02443 family)